MRASLQDDAHAIDAGLLRLGGKRRREKAAGLKFRTHWQDTSGWFNTRRVGESASGLKVLIDEEGSSTSRLAGDRRLACAPPRRALRAS